MRNNVISTTKLVPDSVIEEVRAVIEAREQERTQRDSTALRSPEQVRGLLEYFLERLHEIRWQGTFDLMGCRACDRLANALDRDLGGIGYYFLTSNTPEQDGYHVAIGTAKCTPLVRDSDIGLDFTFDEELSHRNGWPRKSYNDMEEPSYKWVGCEELGDQGER